MLYPLTAPLLDLLVLSIIDREDSYGYQISQQLKSVSTMKDSALYPILRHLSESSFVETYDQPYQGRNRKYYRITENGSRQLVFLKQSWQDYLAEVEKIVNGGGNTGNGTN